MGGVNEASPENLVVTIKNGRLSGRNSPLRLPKPNGDSATGIRIEGPLRRRVAMANLNRRVYGLRRRFHPDPVGPGNMAAVSKLFRLGPHDDASILRSNVQDVERVGSRNSQPPALAHRVSMNPPVLTQNPARSIHDFPLAGSFPRQLLVQKAAGISLGKKPQIHALRLLSNPQLRLPRQIPHRIFGEIAYREEGAIPLERRETEEEVRLVLLRVPGPQQTRSARGRIPSQPCIVTGRQALATQGCCADQQILELHLAVAMGARDRRSSLAILTHEVVDDRLPEFPLHVEDVEREAHPFCHETGIQKIPWRAAPPRSDGLTSGRVVKLQGDPDQGLPLSVKN